MIYHLFIPNITYKIYIIHIKFVKSAFFGHSRGQYSITLTVRK